MYNAHRRAVPALAAAMAAGLIASAAHAETYPPSRNADTFAPPRAASSAADSCTATGTWTDDFGSGPGNWTGNGKKRCHPAGRWTDAFGYTWRVKKGADGTLSGSVNYNHIASCQDQVWPVTGQSDKPNFSVTATNPTGGTDNCATFFAYSLTIQ